MIITKEIQVNGITYTVYEYVKDYVDGNSIEGFQ
jgi:hypothetical protein